MPGSDTQLGIGTRLHWWEADTLPTDHLSSHSGKKYMHDQMAMIWYEGQHSNSGSIMWLESDKDYTQLFCFLMWLGNRDQESCKLYVIKGHVTYLSPVDDIFEFSE